MAEIIQQWLWRIGFITAQQSTGNYNKSPIGAFVVTSVHLLQQF